MSSDKKKKKGFLSKLFGRKTKEDKLAEEAAAKAEAQAKVDAEMAARMAAINAAALKAARKEDEAHLSDAEKARLEEIERQQAEAQALKDAKAARRLQEEKQKAEEAAARKQQEIAARKKAEAEEKARLEAERKAREEQEKARIAALKKAEEEARKKAEQQAKAAEKLKSEKAKSKAAAQAQAEARRLKAEREQAELEAKARLEHERREAERVERERQEAERLRAEAEAREIEKRKALEAQLIKEQAEREAQAAKDREIWEREQAEIAAQKREGGFLNRMSKGLSKSTSAMSENMAALFKKRKLDAEAIQDLEDLLISADFGVGPATRTAELLAKDRFDKQVTDTEIKIALADVISEILTPLEKPLELTGAKPEVLLFVGVNGSGKTTTLGKIAKRYTDDGQKVLIAAADTFRAAAVEQLKVWGERANAPVVSGALGIDASGLVYDAMKRAIDEDFDILMIDTAGRLQNRTELMDELAKIVRVIKKQDATAPHHSILVLDATVGQNALLQTEAFEKTACVTGLIMTKLDGTAKGGVLVALADKFKLPIHAIGIGERIEDLENFSAPVFAAALSGVADAVVEA